jgi:thioredoxin-dependent peroxiredoxin
MALDIGSPAPAFSLPTDEGGPLSLEGLKGKKIVLYFYPKDDTPGCTKEAIGFSCLKDQFDAAGVAVIGVSKDSAAAHAKFRKKHKLTIGLGTDETGAVLEAYGAWVEKSMYGKSYMGIERSTFLIDEAGVLRGVWRKVKVEGHAEAVLAAAKAL